MPQGITSSSSFQGGPLDRPNQAGQSPVQPSEFQFRWNWGARCDLHVNYSPRAFLPIMAACLQNIAPQPRIRSHVQINHRRDGEGIN